MVEITTITIFLLSFYLHSRVAPMSINRINVVSFTFYVHIFFLGYLGSYFILSSDAYFNVVVGEVSKNTEFLVWAWMSYAILTYSLFFYFGAMVGTRYRKPRLAFENFLRSNVTYDRRNSLGSDAVYFFLFAIIAATLLLHLVIFNGTSHLMNFFRLSATDIFRLRTTLSIEFQGIYLFKNIGALFLPFISYYLYSLKQHNTYYRFYFYVFSIFTLIYLIYDLAKSPVIIYLLGFIFVKVYHGKRISWMEIILYISLFFMLFFIIYLMINRNIDLNYMLSPYQGGLVGRIMVSQVSPLYRHLELFPSVYPHIGFNSLSSFIGDPEQKRSARIVMEHVMPTWVANGYGDQLNTSYLGEAWANFGYIGLILAPLWIGFVKGYLIGILIKAPKSPIVVSFLAVISVKTSINSGINDYIYNSIFWGFIIILIFTISMITLLKVSKKLI